MLFTATLPSFRFAFIIHTYLQLHFFSVFIFSVSFFLADFISSSLFQIIYSHSFVFQFRFNSCEFSVFFFCILICSSDSLVCQGSLVLNFLFLVLFYFSASSVSALLFWVTLFQSSFCNLFQLIFSLLCPSNFNFAKFVLFSIAFSGFSWF